MKFTKKELSLFKKDYGADVVYWDKLDREVVVTAHGCDVLYSEDCAREVIDRLLEETKDDSKEV